MLQLILYIDVERVESPDGNQDSESTEVWRAIEITMNVGVTDYGSIVSAIINTHYPYDQMQTIINNHLLGEHEDAYEEMQAYRVLAKATAKQIVEEIHIEESEVNNG